MSLKLRCLQLHVQTNGGAFATTIPFDDGLVLVRADNTMGKSTCFLAIIYALGLERMLGPSTQIPLTHAMTHSVEGPAEESFEVIESHVLLEIQNSNGEWLTIQRQVVGELDKRLMRTWEGPKVTSPTGSYPTIDYYARDPGSVSSEAGFHNRLARFLGWDLPEVSRFNGSDCPLYLEIIFPLFFVEQKHGWAGVQSNLPTFFGIREPAKRALEFVLALDAAQLASKRQQLQSETQRLREEWKERFSATIEAARASSGRITSLTELPTAQWPPSVQPQFEIYRSPEWNSLEHAIAEDEEELREYEEMKVPTAEEAAAKLEQRLAQNRERVAEVEALVRERSDEADSERAQMQAARSRLAALREDLVRNQDALKLRNYGSVVPLKVLDHHCPTCHQGINDTLLSQMSPRQSMTIEDNITFIKNQIDTFEKLELSSRQVVSRKDAELASLRDQLATYRSSVRAIRQTLTAPAGAPSLAAVRERVRLEERLIANRRAALTFDENLEGFANLAKEWAANQSALRALPPEGLSAADKAKADRLEALVKDQLTEFEFKSLPLKLLSISTLSYQLSREGFNLGFDLSASDMIRVIWAYLEGLLELARETTTNHVGLMVFDEPRQQEVKDMSFETLLRRASTSRAHGQQVVFFTSQKHEKLKEITKDLPVTIVNFEGRLIVPVLTQ